MRPQRTSTYHAVVDVPNSESERDAFVVFAEGEDENDFPGQRQREQIAQVAEQANCAITSDAVIHKRD